MRRAVPLAEDCYYHIYNKSIASFKIFLNNNEYLRMFNLIRYYQMHAAHPSYSQFYTSCGGSNRAHESGIADLRESLPKIVDIVAYCLMPTHVHFILRQLTENGISTFMRLVSNSYSKYFNIKHKRKGPLWQGRFQNKLVGSDEQMYHLTRYIHLNPVTAGTARKPQDWKYSSYLEYISGKNTAPVVCDYSPIVDIRKDSYKMFVEDQIEYQKELSLIKNIIFE